MNGIQIRIGDLLYAVIKRWKMVFALTIIGFVFGIAMNGIAYIQGGNMNYEISCSVAVSPQSSSGNFTGNSDYLNPNDFYLSQDMTDAAVFVMESDHVLNLALEAVGVTSVSAEELKKELKIERYNETQILQISLYWKTAEQGVELMNAILDSARKTMLEALTIGAVPTIDEPVAKYLSGSSLYTTWWLVMTILGFGAGIGVALLDLIMRPTLLNVDDVQRLLGLETIGTITKNDAHFREHRNMLQREHLIDSTVTQEFSTTAYILKNLLEKKEKQKCFYVTSVEDGEGKSTVAANLAIQISDMRKKVLLLDMNMRHPGLGKMFLENIDYRRSLNAIYRGETEASEAVVSLTGYLDLLPLVLERNKIPMDDTLFDFVREISKEYEYIIIDTTSIGQNSNVLSLNQIAKMALLVIRYDTAVIQDIENALEKLDKSGTKILGCIVNAVQPMEPFFSFGNKREQPMDMESGSFFDNSQEWEEGDTEVNDTPNILDDFFGEEELQEENMNDTDALDALLKMGIDGSWKEEPDEQEE